MRCRAESDAGKKKELGHALFLAFNEFIAFNLSHMNREETEVNASLWNKYTDAEIHAITADLVSRIPPEKNEVYSRWMMKGLADHEIAGWLKEVREKAPEFVYAGLHAIASAELSPIRMKRLEKALGQTAPVTA
jgi:hydroxypyruvate isomerase